MAKVVIVDLNEVMARGMASLLLEADCTPVGLSTNESELLPIVDSVRPDLVLFGRMLPRSPELLETLFRVVPNARGLAVREWIDAAEVLSLAQQGIIRILHTTAGIAKYRACIGSVLEKCPWIDQEFLAVLLQPRRRSASEITEREVEIIDLVRLGWCNKQIARELAITEGTVKMHMHHIFTKLGLSTRTELALRAAGLRKLSAPRSIGPVMRGSPEALVRRGVGQRHELALIAQKAFRDVG